MIEWDSCLVVYNIVSIDPVTLYLVRFCILSSFGLLYWHRYPYLGRYLRRASTERKEIIWNRDMLAYSLFSLVLAINIESRRLCMGLLDRHCYATPELLQRIQILEAGHLVVQIV